MATIDLNDLDTYIDQRIDAKVNPIINTMLHGWRIVGACEATGTGNQDESLSIVSEFNIASINPNVGGNEYIVSFKDPIATPYIVFASFEANGAAAELYGIYNCTYQGFWFDTRQYTTNMEQQSTYPTRVSLLVLKKYDEL